MRTRTAFAAATLGAAMAAVPATADAGVFTSVKPYVKPVGRQYSIKPLLSVGDHVRQMGHRRRQYRMVGIPDGLGLRKTRHGSELFMNHELTTSDVSEPFVGGPRQRGAFVSRFRLARNGSFKSGDRAYDSVFQGDDYVGAPAQTDNDTRELSRFCSGFLAGRKEGFDRPIYLTNEEESSPAKTFDGKGGQSVAVFNNQLHTLPALGHFAKENTVVVPKTGNRTVIMSLEDGPTTPDSQLYMYVGQKRRRGTPLERNGLTDGKLYTYALDRPKTEADFRSGTVLGRWVEIPDAEDKDASELEAFSDSVGALGFVRIEDGAASPNRRGEFYFVTTGGNDEINRLGRAYRLRLDSSDPTDPATLKVIYNADDVIAAGRDTAISPDNVDVSKRYLMIQEDGTSQSRQVMAAKGRDGSVWRFDIKRGFVRSRVAQLNPPGRGGEPVGPGVWETSGIIDVAGSFGKDNWLTDVQAHSPTAAPFPNTVEDGQLVRMVPRKKKHRR